MHKYAQINTYLKYKSLNLIYKYLALQFIESITHVTMIR